MTGGALAGLKVVEFGSIGPGPFCAMMLADHGADVIRVDRPGEFASVTPAADARNELLHRNRRSIRLDLKQRDDRETALNLVAETDVVVEGNRPGVMERLGLGPDECQRRNPGLVYARITGWGQTGPYSGQVGHDLNYVAVSGTLSLIGPREGPPTIPLALLGDFSSGGMLAAFGIMAALWERQQSGAGQVVDASIVDGAALLATAFHGYRQAGGWTALREDNLVDGGAPFYRVYETADHRWIAVAALEPRFYNALLEVLGCDDVRVDSQLERASWAHLRTRFATIFATRSSAEWVEAASGTDACLTLEEAPLDRHLTAGAAFIVADGITQPAPAPRFSRTPGSLRRPPALPGEHDQEIRNTLRHGEHLRPVSPAAATSESA